MDKSPNVIKPDPPQPVYVGALPNRSTPSQGWVNRPQHFVAFRRPADGPAGLLLAVNPSTVSHISSCWDREHQQNILRIHLINGRYIRIFESEVEDVLEALGLSEYTSDWTLNLERDV
jgi:hypothetical protein